MNKHRIGDFVVYFDGSLEWTGNNCFMGTILKEENKVFYIQRPDKSFIKHNNCGTWTAMGTNLLICPNPEKKQQFLQDIVDGKIKCTPKK